jgi:hypothetical protein
MPPPLILLSLSLMEECKRQARLLKQPHPRMGMVACSSHPLFLPLNPGQTLLLKSGLMLRPRSLRSPRRKAQPPSQLPGVATVQLRMILPTMMTPSPRAKLVRRRSKRPMKTHPDPAHFVFFFRARSAPSGFFSNPPALHGVSREQKIIPRFLFTIFIRLNSIYLFANVYM